MASRTVARSIRFRNFSRYLSALTGAALLACSAVSSVHAQLNWTAPNVSGAKRNPVAQMQNHNSSIQLVQHNVPVPYQPILTSPTIAQAPVPVQIPNVPSPEAILDTTYPESRPSYLQPPTNTLTPSITPPPGSPAIPVGKPISPPDGVLMNNEDYGNYGNMRIVAGQTGCVDPRSITKPMSEIGYDISMNATELPVECPINYGEYVPRAWPTTCFQFKASALCTKAAYFEDVDLERYGHSWGPFLQPVISGGKFFLTVPLLPYKMGLVPPNECVYTLGHYRPGSCAPYIIDPLPISIRAGLFQAGAIVGGVYLIP